MLHMTSFSGGETVRVILLALAFLGLLTVDSPLAQLLSPASDDVKIQVTQQEMDEDAAGRVPKSHAQAMARQFHVDAQVVDKLREAKLSWGETGVRLALANELIRTDPKTYESVEAALLRVNDLRAKKAGWGSIARDLGVDLGQVVTHAQQVRQQMRAEAKNEATTGVIKPGQTQVEKKEGQGDRSKRGGQPR